MAGGTWIIITTVIIRSGNWTKTYPMRTIAMPRIYRSYPWKSIIIITLIRIMAILVIHLTERTLWILIIIIIITVIIICGFVEEAGGTTYVGRFSLFDCCEGATVVYGSESAAAGHTETVGGFVGVGGCSGFFGAGEGDEGLMGEGLLLEYGQLGPEG